MSVFIKNIIAAPQNDLSHNLRQIKKPIFPFNHARDRIQNYLVGTLARELFS